MSGRLRSLLGGRGGTGTPAAARAPLGLLDLLREGPAPLAPGGAARADAVELRIGIVIPPFRKRVFPIGRPLSTAEPPRRASLCLPLRKSLA